MITRLYIQDRFITTIGELRQLVEDAGDNPSTIVAKQLIAAACDGVLESWLKDSLDEIECQQSLTQERFANLKDTERWKCIKEAITGTTSSTQWNWQDKIELVKAPDDSLWETFEKEGTVYLKFSFRCKEVMDERVKLKMQNQVLTLDMNKTTQEITFNIGSRFKGNILELYIEDNKNPIWRQEREYGVVYRVEGVSFKMIRVEGQGNPFYIGETEVTQALWQAVMGSNPSRFKGSNRPVESVSWDDCKEFIRKLNSITGKSFRLPKEKEWEFAAKGGNKSHGYEYSGSNNIDEVAWYDKNAYYCGWSIANFSHPDYGTHNVKTKRPNELDIYDMTGNVWEWCEDLYDTSSSRRVYRGGSWSTSAGGLSYRNFSAPSYAGNYLGFRLAL